MVDGLFFCATLTGRRGGHTPFVQAERKRPTPVRGAEAVEPEPGSSWEGHSVGGVYRCLELKYRVLWGCTPTPRCIDDPPTAPHVFFVVRKTDELLCGGYKWASRFEASCSCTRWTGRR